MVRRYTIKREIWSFLDEHPQVSYQKLQRVYSQYKGGTVWAYWHEWNRYNESDTKKLKEIIKELVIILKTKTDSWGRLSRVELEIMRQAERIALTWMMPGEDDGLEDKERVGY